MKHMKLALGFLAVLALAGSSAQAASISMLGVVAVPDGGVTIAMLGAGLVCLGLMNRKSKK